MTDETMVCSFCGKTQKEVKKLIAGRSDKDEAGQGKTVYICDECIGLCQDILKGEIEKNPQLELEGLGGEQPLKKPQE